MAGCFVEANAFVWRKWGRLTLADISVGYVLGLSQLTQLHHLIPPVVAEYEARLKARPAYQRAYAR